MPPSLKRLPALLFGAAAPLLFAQQPSIHRLQSAEHAGEPPAAVFAPEVNTSEFNPPREAAPAAPLALTPPATQPAVDKVVFGFLPYWEVGQPLDYSRLTHVAYHAIDPATDGSVAAWNGWPGSAPIAAAHAAGTRVLLNITNFNMTTSTFLATPASRTALITTVVNSLKAANADGAVIDFEAVSAAQRNNLIAFTQEFKTALTANLPRGELYLATPAVDWSGAYAYRTLALSSDGLFIMAYDYYYSGSTTAGPVDPLNASARWDSYSVGWTVNDYLTYAGTDMAPKLFLGVPYYGYDWPTNSLVPPSGATANATAKIYTTAVANAATYGRQWDSPGSVPFYAYTATTPHQCFYDDDVSLALKYDLANTSKFGGAGMWALGYDGARTELYSLLRDKFELPWPMAIGDLTLAKGAGGAVNLAWGAIGVSASGKNLAVSNYRVYRGATANFLPLNPAPLGSPAATNYSDPAVAGAQFYQVTALSAQGIEGLIDPPVIVDDAQALVTGSWTASVNVAGFWGAGYKVHASGGAGVSSLGFAPVLWRPARYFVLGHHTAATDRSALAPYTLTGRFGLSQAAAQDERYFGGAWTPLFDADLGAGGGSTAKLDDSAPAAAGGYVIGDAVLFAPDPRETILDDRDAEANSWPSSASVTGYYGDRYIYQSLPSASALRWNPYFDLEADYDLFARWTAGANRTTAAVYTVTDATGVHPVIVNQQLNNNAWVLLGTYHFRRGQSGIVSLSSADSANVVIGDAIRFVKK
jgi:spore germination protein YaaH